MKPGIVKAIAFWALASPCAAAFGAETYVVLVDVSSSIRAEDRKVYGESFGHLLKALKPGDRVVVSPMGRRGRSEWIRETDAEVPKGTGKRFADEKRRAAFDDGLGKAFASLLERSARDPENATRILDSIEASSDAFARSPGSGKTLVILSDMEESGRFDLASGAKRQVRAPESLKGASVYVAGAGGGRNYVHVESFWRGYFGTAPEARLVQYGRYPADPGKGRAK